MSTSKDRKLLDEIRDVMRLHHYSIHTERTYCDWVKRYIRYHSMTGRQDLIDGEAKIEAFLTHLAVDKTVAPSTQNQAMNALVFLYKHVLKQPRIKILMRFGHPGRSISPWLWPGKR